MRAGELRDRISIQKPPATNAGGVLAGSWTDLYVNVPAKVRPVSGREFFARQVVAAEISTIVKLRYRSAPLVKESMRVSYEGRTLEIHAVIDVDGMHRELQLMCAEIR